MNQDLIAILQKLLKADQEDRIAAFDWTESLYLESKQFSLRIKFKRPPGSPWKNNYDCPPPEIVRKEP